MTGKTHLNIGLASTAAIFSITTTPAEPKTMITALSLTALGALMPDIDLENTKISNLFIKLALYLGILAIPILLILNKNGWNFSAIISFSNLNISGAIILLLLIALSKFSKHRTFTHSLLGLILFSWGVYVLLNNSGHLFLYFILGYVLHLIADSFTFQGIQLLFPFKPRQAIGIVKTGGIMDNILSIICFTLTTYLLFNILTTRIF